MQPSQSVADFSRPREKVTQEAFGAAKSARVRTASTWRVLRGWCTATLLAGCGGGAPLLHPVHPLPPDQVSFGAGVSHTVVLGEADEQLANAKSASASGGAASPEGQDAILTGALAESMTSPGIAPWVGARAGLGYNTEAGLTYTGRSARLDARHVFIDESLALSVGLGASGRLAPRGSDGGSVPGVDTSAVTGFGIDLPVLVGYRSPGQLLSVYGGVRAHFDRAFGDVPIRLFADPTEERVGDLDAIRVGGSGLVGMLIGVEPIWIALEASVGVFHGDGFLRYPSSGPGQPGQPGQPGRRVDTSWTAPIVSPAGALLTRF